MPGKKLKSFYNHTSMRPRIHSSAPLELIFLGTNGWYDTATGNTVCALIKTAKFDLILDAGSGLAKLDKYCDFKKPVYVFLSHLHLDHVSGLHCLAKFRFGKGLKISAPRVYGEALRRLLAAPYTAAPEKLPYKVSFAWLPGGHRFPFKAECAPLEHADPVLGYSFEIEGRKVAYITDTGYCRNALRLARGADLLITECAYRKGEKNEKWPHFNPETAAGLAREAGAKNLVMTHFAADRYPSFASRKKALAEARKIFRNARAASDGLRIKV